MQMLRWKIKHTQETRKATWAGIEMVHRYTAATMEKDKAWVAIGTVQGSRTALQAARTIAQLGARKYAGAALEPSK